MSGAEHSADQLLRDIRATLMPGFVGTTLPAWLERRLTDGLGGVAIFGGNVESLAQLRALTDAVRAARPEAVIAIDEEGGDVTRLFYAEGSPYPGNAVLGRIDDLDYTAEVAARVGRTLRSVGCTLTMAPDVDVNSNPHNPVIGVRSFGADTELAARHSAAWVRGVQSTGIAACPKHFPGHGDTAQDSHLALPIVDASPELLAARDLPPFSAAIDAGALCIMTSHILLPQIDPHGPATFSTSILQGLLRGQLGFAGVIVSDALDMRGASGEIGIPAAAVRALTAGCDLLCIGTENTDDELAEIEAVVLRAVTSGRLPAARVHEAAARVRALSSALPAPVSELRAAGLAEAESSTAASADFPGEDEVQRVLASFDGVPEAHAWLAAHPGATIVRVDTEANIAVGVAPWGPFAAALRPANSAKAQASAVDFLARRLVTVDAETPIPWECDASAVMVLGRDLHRHEFARDGIDALREHGVSVFTIDTGWPGHDRGYAGLATYGASRLVGAALLSLVQEDPR